MEFFILLKFVFCVCLLAKASDATNTCFSAKCSLLSPEIRFPFRIQGLHPQQCGVPDFNLFCRENKTMIHFPDYGDLVVKSISYGARRLNLLDPKNCVHEVFLNLNVSLTPFSYYYVLKHYKYINCSIKLGRSLEQVPCLSGSAHHVYVVEPSFSVPDSCSSVKTVAIPFSYCPYLSDSSFGLGFTWNRIGLEEEEGTIGGKSGILTETGHLRKHLKGLNAASCLILLAFIVGILLYATLPQYLERLNEEKLKGMIHQAEINSSLGEYEALNLAVEAPPNAKAVDS